MEVYEYVKQAIKVVEVESVRTTGNVVHTKDYPR